MVKADVTLHFKTGWRSVTEHHRGKGEGVHCGGKFFT